MRGHAFSVSPYDTEARDFVAIGLVPLLVPFFLVVAAILVFGTQTRAQILGAGVLLLVPLVIVALQRARKRTL